MRKTTVAAFTLWLIAAGVASAQTTAASEAGPFSLSAEALLWWFKSSPAPVPLVSDGQIDEIGTRVFLGAEDIDTNPNPGLRVTAGYSLTERWGVEGSVLYVPSRSTSRTASASGEPGSEELVIPFFDVTLPGENATQLSSEGQFAGTATEKLSNSLLGAELDGTMTLLSTAGARVDLLGGFRYLRLRETYTFTTDSPNVPPLPADVFQTKDEFDATNNFYGAQVGVRARVDRGPWFMSGGLRLALGAAVQSVDVDGVLLTNDFNGFGAPQTFAGGYFAQPTNIGSYSRSVFAAVPEFGLTVGYQLTRWASVVAGYTFLYMSNVARPAEQLDRNINPTQSASFGGTPPTPLVGPARPSFELEESDFWAQGLTVGLAVRF